MGAEIAVYIIIVAIVFVSLVDRRCRCHRSFLFTATAIVAFVVVFALLVPSVAISA